MADSFVADSFAPDAPAKGPAPVDPAEQREKGVVLPTGRLWKPGRTALDVILNPQGTLENIISIPASMALTGGAGTLATKVLPNLKYAGMLGRAASEGVQRGVGALTQGESPTDIAKKAAMGAATGLGTEGLMGLIGRGFGGVARLREAQKMGTERAEQAFSRAGTLATDALDAIKNRLAGRKIFGGGVTLPANIYVPSLSKARLTVDDAVQKLASVSGAKWHAAVEEIASALDKLDKTKLVPGAGDIFRAAVPATRQAPLPGSVPFANTALARTAADVLTGTPVEGRPVGGLAAEGVVANPPHVPLWMLLRGGH
jgi:hypothetical protein